MDEVWFKVITNNGEMRKKKEKAVREDSWNENHM